MIDAIPAENSTSDAKCAPIIIREMATKKPQPIMAVVIAILFGSLISLSFNNMSKGSSMNPMAECPDGNDLSPVIP